MSNFIYHSSFKTELYQSDHHQLVLYLDKRSLFLSITGSSNKKPQLSKLKYQYDRMDSALWDSFSTAIDDYTFSNFTLSGLNEFSIRMVQHLNSVWNNLRTCIIKATKAYISHHHVSPNSSQRIPKPITILQHKIKSLNKIYYQFCISLLKQNLWSTNDV